MSKNLVSVIIPNYNHAKFLDERIQSVLNQTYQDFELIILDDCSSDNGASKSIIEKYRKNPHVSQIVYNDVNSGSTFKQWQKGMELAKGEIIWIAESDDSCDNTFLETLVFGYLGNNAVLAFCRSCQYDTNGNKSPYGPQAHLSGDMALSGKDFISRYMIDCNIVANASSAIFSRDAAMSIDGQYMTMLGEGDWLFWLKLMGKGNVFFCSKELNYFRSQVQSTTSRLAAKGVGAIEHKIVFDYLVDNRYVPTRLVFIRKKNYICELLKIDYFESNNVRRRVFRIWDRYYLYRICILFSNYKKRFVNFLDSAVC